MRCCKEFKDRKIRIITKSILIVLLLLFSTQSTKAVINTDYQDLFESHHSIMLIIHVESGQIEYANQAAIEFYGYPNLLEKSIHEINTLSTEQLRVEFDRAVKEERNYFIFKHRLANGEIKSVEVRSYPFVSNGTSYLYSIINDRTEVAWTEFLNRFLMALVILGLMSWLIVIRWSMKKLKKSKEQIEQKNERIERMIDATKAGSVEFDVISGTMVVDHRFKEIYGREDKEYENLTISTFVSWLHEADQTVISKAIQFAQKTNDDYLSLEYRVLHPSRGLIWIAAYGKVASRQNEKIARIMGTVIDVSERKKSDEERSNLQKKYQTVLNAVNIGAWEYFLEENRYWTNDEFLTMLGTSRDIIDAEFASYSEFWESRVYEEDLEEAEASFKKYLESGSTDIYESQYRILHTDGKYRWILSRGNMVNTMNGRVFYGVYIDVTEMKIREFELTYMSERDYLTGLYNRRYFQSTVSQWIEESEQTIGFVLVDLNGLRLINDTFGMQRGDQVLNQFAIALAFVEMKFDLLARVGGDEFIYAIKNCDEVQLNAMKSAIYAHITDQSYQGLKISASVGTSLLKEGMSITEAFKLAEDDLYRVKAMEERSTLNQSIKVILKTLTQKYRREEVHSHSVSYLCRRMGEVMNLTVDDVKELELSGLLHDIGKIAIDDHILNKPGQLSKEEYQAIQMHAQFGYQLLRAADQYSNIAINALCHHEHYDGNGYPYGLKGEEIPLFSRVICIVDAYEAMTSDRIYRKGRSKEEAIEELQRCAGTQFDPNLVGIFVNEVLEILDDEVIDQLNGFNEESKE